MNVAIVNDNMELIAYVSDEHMDIIKSGYEIIHYGNNEPVFEKDITNGKIYIAENKFIVDLND